MVVIQFGPSQVSALWNSEVRGYISGGLVVCKSMEMTLKCLHYHRWPHFMGVYKVGFHCLIVCIMYIVGMMT